MRRILIASLSVFRDMFGEECVDFSDEKNISVTVDGKTIHICLETRVRTFSLVAPRHRTVTVVSDCF